VVALRIRYNERNEFLETTTPPSNEMLQAGTAEVDFPEIVNGAGWTTQFNLFSGVTNQATRGTLTFMQPNATPFHLGTNNLIPEPPVTLTSIAPSTVAQAGTVVLTGTNMGSSNIVVFTTSFGMVSVTPSATTSTSLTATLPPNAITGPVFVLNGSQQSAPVILQVTGADGLPQLTTVNVASGANTAGTDIYVPPPAGSLSFTAIGTVVNGAGNAYPASATFSKGSSQRMALVGTGFTSSTTVSAGPGVTVSSVTLFSPTEILATISVSETAASGPRSITVVNPDGDASILTGGLIIQ
jgi:hypothetical protein